MIICDTKKPSTSPKLRLPLHIPSTTPLLLEENQFPNKRIEPGRHVDSKSPFKPWRIMKYIGLSKPRRWNREIKIMQVAERITPISRYLFGGILSPIFVFIFCFFALFYLQIRKNKDRNLEKAKRKCSLFLFVGIWFELCQLLYISKRNSSLSSLLNMCICMFMGRVNFLQWRAECARKVNKKRISYYFCKGLCGIFVQKLFIFFCYFLIKKCFDFVFSFATKLINKCKNIKCK